MFKTKIINLDRRTDRWDTFKKTALNNLTDYERFSAIDGKELKLTPEIRTMFKNNKFNWRGGIMGACLSHYYCWKDLTEDPSCDYYLIFEDDVKFCDNFKDKLAMTADKLKHKTYPMLLLGYTSDKEFIKKIYDHDLNDILIYELKNKAHIWGGIFAYFIHKSFAQKLVTKINKDGFVKPADVTVFEQDDLYMTAPVLVHSEFMSAVYNIDSDIQYDLLNINDGYEFHSLKDSMGHDLCSYPGKTIAELQKIADADARCMGFNTYGYLKYKIRDENEFVRLPGTDYKLHGLYVKRK
jgi:GR25 family glycosyltransferase involved in LPS biosynthesis